MNEPTATKPAGDIARGHTVRGYDRDLTRLRDLILEMGERVVEQTQTAMAALLGEDLTPAYRVLDREPQIDYLALDADEEAFHVIVRRQPKAIDLRIVLALARIADEAERAGDKAARIAHRTISLRERDAEVPESVRDQFRRLDQLVCCAFERAMGAVATFDIDGALGVFEDEALFSQVSSELVRELTLGDWPEAQPKEPEPVPTRVQLEALLAIAHALNRIGNHAAGIAEQVIYVAEGQDVRFRDRAILIETLRHRTERD
jgi:phosphate transport system protein